MKLWLIKKNTNIQVAKLYKGDVYLLPDDAAENLEKNFPPQLGKPRQYYDLYDFYDFFEPYKIGSDKKLLLLRFGGFGDLVAISCFGHITNKINLLTFIKYKSVTDYWAVTPTIHDVNSPIFRGVDPIKMARIRKLYGYADINDIIEKGHRKNWYEIFWELLGVKEINPDYCRPYLKLNSYKKYDIDILGVFMATSRMRTIDPFIFFSAIRNAFPNRKLYGYEAHGYKLPDFVQKITAPTSYDFVHQIISARLVITVDTMPIHLREGLGLPAIAIYFSFESSARTKYYKYTRSIDIKTPCPLQPCYLHSQKFNDYCPMANPEETSAPCMGRMMIDPIALLTENLKKC